MIWKTFNDYPIVSELVYKLMVYEKSPSDILKYQMNI
nr:MAG TPA: hypothetical protein [Caudoviricetes sp.]